MATLETRVYYNASVTLNPTQFNSHMGYLSILGDDYVRIQSIDYDPYFFTAYHQDADNSTAYDWCVATLQEEVDTNYYFRCASAATVLDELGLSTLEGMEISTVGYPAEYSFVRWGSSGYVISRTDAVMEHSIDVSKGQSGAPIAKLMQIGSAVCFGIVTGASPTTEYNRACVITSSIYNVICNVMQGEN